MEIRYINTTQLIYCFIGFIIFDVVSLTAYTFPLINWLLLPLIIFGLGYLAFRNLRWGLILPLAELAWGSFGMNLTWDINEFRITLRMVMLAVFIGVWLLKTYVLQRYYVFPLHSRLGKLFIIVMLIIAWGIINGLIHDNTLANIYHDANAYFFLLYLPLWSMVFKHEEIRSTITVLVSAAVALSIKTLFFFHIFANQYEFMNIMYWYLWIRDTRIGEITLLPGNIWRIFIQSQLNIVIVFIWYLVYVMRRTRHRFRYMLVVVPSLMMAALVVSFSRSFWLGIIMTIIAGTVFFGPYIAKRYRPIIIALMYFTGSLVLAVGLIWFLVFIPYQGNVSLSQSFFNRSLISTDAAGISRLKLLTPLLSAIHQRPLLGTGFGTTLTYTSQDPRIKTIINPEGIVTTYAFEWGYLDQWLKLGGISFAAFLLIVFGQFYFGWAIVRRKGPYQLLVIGLLAGLFCIMVIHTVSPYLNHPLGLGYLMLTMVVLSFISREMHYEKTYY